MRFNVIRVLSLPLIILGIIFFLALNGPATAAPPDASDKAIGRVAEKAGVTLEKQPGAEVIPLGQVISFTVTIKNDSRETINATLTDELPPVPEGLALQSNSTTPISATAGTVQAEGNTLVWSGSVAAGEQVTITYGAIPPTTSTPDRELTNVAVLQFGNNTLEASATITTQAPDLNIWRSFVNFIAIALVFFDEALISIRVPYAFGFAIILFTVVIRAATFPLNMQQIKSSKAMQELQPQLKAMQEKFKGDREKLAQEQMRLYKEHGVNPLGGCLPMIVQMPIWFALYQALIQLAGEGLLSEGFFWIPSLAGPVSSYGGGMGWLWPLPPSIGWVNAIAYLVMPVLLIVSQFYTQKLMTPPSSDPQQAQMQNIMKFMPLMFGYISLIVPSGLTLYWFTSNLLGVAQHYFTRTQLNQPSVKTESGSKTPVSANVVPADGPSSESEESGTSKKQRHGKSKRKSKRKR